MATQRQKAALAKARLAKANKQETEVDNTPAVEMIKENVAEQNKQSVVPEKEAEKTHYACGCAVVASNNGRIKARCIKHKSL